MKRASEWIRRTRQIGMALLMVGFMGACTDNTTPPPPRQTLVDVVAANSNFSILRDAIEYAGLSSDLRLNTVTIFAPTNAAFQAAGFADPAAVKTLATGTVRSLLLYHMLGFNVPASALVVGKNTAVPTLQGGDIYVTKTASAVSVNNARVTATDMRAENGLIHTIDRVLMPPTLNLLEIAQGDPSLTYLVAAATRAATGNPAVVSALTSTSNAFTVFAPTNEAFIAAGFPSIASIQAAPAATLAAVILNHVVADRAFSPTLANGNVTTAGSGQLAVDVSNGVTVKSNGNTVASKVLKADILATNGVVHVIDRVLLP